MHFIPTPGTYIAEEIKEEGAVLVGENKTQLAKGKVVAVGEGELTDFGKYIAMPVKVGDVAFFLSYEGGYDHLRIDNKTYYSVLRKDHRFVLEKK